MVSKAKRLKALKSENATLKKLLANAMLDNAALKDLLTKNGDARCQARGRGSPQRMTVRYSRRRPDDPGCATGLWHWHGNVADSATGAC